MHISMFHGTPDDFIQVTCHQEKYQDKLKALGFVTSVEKLNKRVGAPEPKGVITPVGQRAKLTRKESK